MAFVAAFSTFEDRILTPSSMNPSDPPSDRSPDDKETLHRRGFFTEGLRNFLRPLADIVEQRMEAFNASGWGAGDDDPTGTQRGSTGAYDDPYSPGEYESMYGEDAYGSRSKPLRPPGALPEGEFLARCTSSGQCVQACPVSAIRLDWSGHPTRNGKPVIEPELQACVLCTDLSCTKVCPTGAIQPVARDAIRIGVARWKAESCFRTSGEDCRICVDKCPVGRRAIDIPRPGADISVNPEACTGCGVCEMSCPAQPRAIVVERAE